MEVLEHPQWFRILLNQAQMPSLISWAFSPAVNAVVSAHPERWASWGDGEGAEIKPNLKNTFLLLLPPSQA